MSKRKTAGNLANIIFGIVLTLGGGGLAVESCSNLPHKNTKQYEIQQPSLLEQGLYTGGVILGFASLGRGLYLLNEGFKKKNNYN